MSQSLTIPKWYDLHTHFRQGENVASYVADHLAMGCAGALAMPNTQPPVSKIEGENTPMAWSIEKYRQMLIEAGADQFDQLIVPLYLTKDTTPEDIERGAKSGLLRACKYYPPHGTTNSAHGVPIEDLLVSDVISAMEANGIILCIHGEQHGLPGPEYFDSGANAETRFYEQWMTQLVGSYEDLKVVCEHITTETAVEFVEKMPSYQVGATITPQHLLFTVGHLIQGFRYHLYCLPLVKFEKDRAALRRAIANPRQTQFFAGTDSAPHVDKFTECGCAAGCYTGGCAPQLYAMAFEEAGIDLFSEAGLETFTRFLSTNGPGHYGFPPSKETFELSKTAAEAKTKAADVTPLPAGIDLDLTWSL